MDLNVCRISFVMAGCLPGEGMFMLRLVGLGQSCEEGDLGRAFQGEERPQREWGGETLTPLKTWKSKRESCGQRTGRRNLGWMTIEYVGNDSKFYPKTMELLCCSGNVQAGKRCPVVNPDSVLNVMSSSLGVALGCHETMLYGNLSHSGDEKRIRRDYLGLSTDLN